MSTPNTSIPKGSIVLVTGVNGYIGSNTANELLRAGFRVRGTVRNSAKADWCREYFPKTYGSDAFEVAIVEDIGEPGAFDKARQGQHIPLLGCAGVAHTASDVSFDLNPDKVITPMIAGMKNILDTAGRYPEIKRFVYTSSSAATSMPKADTKMTIHASSWNTEAIQLAHAPPPYTAERSIAVYAASKTEAEQAAWEFMRERKPSFNLNTVLPNLTLGGHLLHPNQPQSTNGAIQGVYHNNADTIGFMKRLPPQYCIDVVDVARLHVAPFLYPDVQNERLLAYSEPVSFNAILQLIRKINPERSLPDEIEGSGRDISTVDTAKSVELLKRLGRPGFVTLEQSMRDCIAAA